MQILKISVYHLHDRIGHEEYHLGRRMIFYEGNANWESLINNEMAWNSGTSKNCGQASADQNVPDVRPSAFIVESRRMVVVSKLSA